MSFALFSWPLAVALVGVQVVIAILSFVVLCLPLSNTFARRTRRKRVLLLWVGAMSAIMPLVYFGQLAAVRGFADYAWPLGTSLLYLVMQVVLYYLEDRRSDSAYTGPDSRLRSGRDLRASRDLR